MAIALTGPFGLPVKHLQNSLAESAALRTAFGVATVSEAKERILIYGADDRECVAGTPNPFYIAPPRAIIWLRGGSFVESAHNVLQWGGGQIEVRIELPIVKDDIQEETGLVTPDGAAKFLNDSGPIFKEAMALKNTAGCLSLSSPQLLQLGQEYTESTVPNPVMICWFVADFRGLL